MWTVTHCQGGSTFYDVVAQLTTSQCEKLQTFRTLADPDPPGRFDFFAEKTKSRAIRELGNQERCGRTTCAFDDASPLLATAVRVFDSWFLPLEVKADS